jgi:uncharacterized membrane protein
MMLDFGWLMINNGYYLKLANEIQKEPFIIKVPAFLLTYIAIFITFYLYAKLLTFDNQIILYGVLFGLGVYGTFSFTTCVFFKNYSYYNAVIDAIWGPALYIIGGLAFNYLYLNKK